MCRTLLAIHSFIDSFTHHIFNEHLLCARHCRYPSDSTPSRPLSSSWSTSRSISKECHFNLIQLNNTFKKSPAMLLGIGDTLIGWTQSRPSEVFRSSMGRQMPNEQKVSQETSALTHSNPTVHSLIRSYNFSCCVTHLSLCLSYSLQPNLPSGHDPASHTSTCPESLLVWQTVSSLSSKQVSSAWLWRPPPLIYRQGVVPQGCLQSSV